MEVILLEHVSRLGAIGDVVNVRPGFARNFLIPKEKALRATKDNLAKITAEKAVLEQKNTERKAEAEKEAKNLEGAVATVVRQAAEDGKLYGSVAVRDIAAALQENGKHVDARMIDLSAPIKALGVYTVKASLHPQVVVDIKVHVARNADSPLPEEIAEEVEEKPVVMEATSEDSKVTETTETAETAETAETEHVSGAAQEDGVENT